ncbi:MAG TPA: hypothetical protein VFE58_08620 [Tepidisphaeraceae bacterium]|nr:hypothetical protein [Tepidisphaeraceae bacterium]
MAAHATHHRLDDDRTELGDRAKPITQVAWIAGIVGLVASVALGFFANEDHSFQRFLYAYLASYGFFLSIGIGALAFVLIQHLTRAGWSVNVRRIAEALSVSTMSVLVVLSLPILISVVMQHGTLYSWALPISAAEHGEVQGTDESKSDDAATMTAPAAESADQHQTIAGVPIAVKPGPDDAGEPGVLTPEMLKKRHYLNPSFFMIRMAFYLVFWVGASMWYWKQSVRQDTDGNPGRTAFMQSCAPVCAILLLLTLTFGAFDLLMSVDPLWFSTIFGVYFFAGCLIAIFATLSLLGYWLQSKGLLRQSITVEHYHDLGKLLFAFCFFWGYIAFAQFMLLWYSNIPEETAWWRRHGGSGVSADITIWTYVVVVLLFGKLLIPFPGLLSRHVKRSKGGLIFWSVWMLIFQALDIFWIVVPQIGANFNLLTVVIYVAAFIGMGGVIFATFLKVLGAHSLRPQRDPRLSESMAFTNI